MIVLSGLWVKYWVGFQQGWRERKNNWFVNFCDGQLPDITVKTPPTVRHLFRQFAVLKRRIKVSASCHFYKFWLCRVVECVQLWWIEVVSNHEVEKIKKELSALLLLNKLSLFLCVRVVGAVFFIGWLRCLKS